MGQLATTNGSIVNVILVDGRAILATPAILEALGASAATIQSLSSDPQRFQQLFSTDGQLPGPGPVGQKALPAPKGGGSFNPADFVGKQAVVSPHLKAGTYTALVVDGKVYVARMHISAWELAGKQGVEQFYGFAEIDAAGNVLRLFK